MKKLFVSLGVFFMGATLLGVVFLNCAGQSGSSAPTNNNTVNGSLNLSDLYVGAYLEDPSTNPEDPTPGFLYLTIPSSGNFSGQMYFTFAGCQNSNIGIVSGNHSGANLAGSWSGDVDGTNQSGNFSGTYVVQSTSFQGTYTVSKGKQYFAIPNCISYYIAPNGAFGLWPVGVVFPNSFNFTSSSDGASWGAVAGATLALVSLVDAQAAVDGSAGAILQQKVFSASQVIVSWQNVNLISGKTYIASVTIVNSAQQVLSHGSSTFIK